MSNTALNDMSYNFEPLKLFQRDKNYTVDETELKKSRDKSRELIAQLRKSEKK